MLRAQLRGTRCYVAWLGMQRGPLFFLISRDKAAALLELDSEAHALSKKRLRADTLRKIRTALPLDLKDALVLGVKRATKAKLAR